MKPKILLVDDEEQILAYMRWVLDTDYEIFAANNEMDALNLFTTHQPSVAVVDLCLNRANLLDLGGLRLVKEFLEKDPAIRIIVVTGNDDDANALQAVRLGVHDYYAKPIRLADLKVMIQRAIEVHRIHHRLKESPEFARGLSRNQIQAKPSVQFNAFDQDIDSFGGQINLKLAKKTVEFELVKKALAKNNGIVSRAAKELGISRVNLYELIEKHKIEVQQFKTHRLRPARHKTWEV